MSEGNADESKSSGSSGAGASSASQEVVFTITPASNSDAPDHVAHKKAAQEKPNPKHLDRRDSLSLQQHIRLPQELQVPTQGLK